MFLLLEVLAALRQPWLHADPQERDDSRHNNSSISSLERQKSNLETAREAWSLPNAPIIYVNQQTNHYAQDPPSSFKGDLCQVSAITIEEATHPTVLAYQLLSQGYQLNNVWSALIESFSTHVALNFQLFDQLCAYKFRVTVPGGGFQNLDIE